MRRKRGLEVAAWSLPLLTEEELTQPLQQGLL